MTTKTYLAVPYDEKDKAKALGAKWDGAAKKWYVPEGLDVTLFAKWDASKTRHFTFPAYMTQPQAYNAGEIFVQKGVAYKVIGRRYCDDDEDRETAYYSVQAKDISDTPEGMEVLREYNQSVEEANAKKAEKQKIEELKKVIKDNGVAVKRENNELRSMPQGIVIRDTFDIYGGGEKIVVTNEDVWLIINNGADGDDWAHNTIRTGGAGAFGWAIPVSAVQDHLRGINAYTGVAK